MRRRKRLYLNIFSQSNPVATGAVVGDGRDGEGKGEGEGEGEAEGEDIVSNVCWVPTDWLRQWVLGTKLESVPKKGGKGKESESSEVKSEPKNIEAGANKTLENGGVSIPAGHGEHEDQKNTTEESRALATVIRGQESASGGRSVGGDVVDLSGTTEVQLEKREAEEPSVFNENFSFKGFFCKHRNKKLSPWCISHCKALSPKAYL